MCHRRQYAPSPRKRRLRSVTHVAVSHHGHARAVAVALVRIKRPRNGRGWVDTPGRRVSRVDSVDTLSRACLSATPPTCWRALSDRAVGVREVFGLPLDGFGTACRARPMRRAVGARLASGHDARVVRVDPSFARSIAGLRRPLRHRWMVRPSGAGSRPGPSRRPSQRYRAGNSTRPYSTGAHSEILFAGVTKSYSRPT